MKRNSPKTAWKLRLYKLITYQIEFIQNGYCPCGKSLQTFHHIDGREGIRGWLPLVFHPQNIVGLCNDCHTGNGHEMHEKDPRGKKEQDLCLLLYEDIMGKIETVIGEERKEWPQYFQFGKQTLSETVKKSCERFRKRFLVAE